MTKYLCVKDVFLKNPGFYAFVEGVIYEGELGVYSPSGPEGFILENHRGDAHFVRPAFLEEHFIIAPEPEPVHIVHTYYYPTNQG